MKQDEILQQVDYEMPKKFHQALYDIYSEDNSTVKGWLNIFKNKGKEKKISQKSAALGLLFLNAYPSLRSREYWSYNQEIYHGNKRFNKFAEDYDLDRLWDGEYYELLEFFFGEERAPYVKKAWDELPNFMYQTGWDRRSFRRPHHKPTTYVRQLNFIISLINYEANHSFSIKEAISYSNTINSSNETAHMWAAAINSGNEEIYQHVTGILTGEAEVGTVSRNIIRALLLSNKPEAWENVGDLLLAAQRQEGLRQVILECIDETSEGALQYIIDLVLEHNLTRFSAVIRALDTWAGFGWDAEKQSTVKRFMEMAQKYYRTPELIETAIKEKDNAEVYMSLWGLGAHDIDKCYPYLKQLYQNGNVEKKTLALYFVRQAGISDWNTAFGQLAIEEDSPQLQYWGVNLYPSMKAKDKSVLFQRLLSIYHGFEKKEMKFTGKVFSWLEFTFKKSQVGNLLIDMTKSKDEAQMQILLNLFDDMDIENREALVRKILPEYKHYYYNNRNQDKPRPKPTLKQRDFAFRILKDRSSYIRDTAMLALSEAELNKEEIQVFEDLLSRKSASFRQFAIGLIQKRPSQEILESAERLIIAKNVEQRLAGLDLLNGLLNEDLHEERIKALAETYTERSKIGRKEQVLLDNLLAEKAIEYNADNGYGLFNPNTQICVNQPESPTSGEFYERHFKGKYPFGLSMSLADVQAKLNELAELYLANKDYEYEIEYWNGSRDMVLLGNTLSPVKKVGDDWTPRQQFDNYPLAHVWEKWFADAGFTAFDLYLIIHSAQHPLEEPNVFQKTFHNLQKDLPVIPIPLVPERNSYWNGAKRYSRINPILQALTLIYPYKNEVEYSLGSLQYYLSKFSPEDIQVAVTNPLPYRNEKLTVVDMGWHKWFLLAPAAYMKDEKLFAKYFNSMLFMNRNTPEEAFFKNKITLQDYCHAHSLRLCSKDELFDRILQTDAIDLLTIPDTYNKKNLRRKSKDELFATYDFLPEMVEQARNRILEVELRRGDSSTPVTLLAQSIQSVYGIDYFVQILNALGKDNLNRGYIYSYGSHAYSKKEVLSTLLKRCNPLKTDTQEEFDQKIKEGKFTEKRLVEVGLYTQQWLPFIAKYLDWEGMESAAWWLHAHTNGYHTAETETEVARYSNIPIERFQDGAVDYDWFQQAYTDLGKQRWKTMYDAAKYISDGTGHSRAKLYADVMTGDMKIREVTKRVKDKRNKDYVRVYGLVPLSKKIPKKDLLNRYNYLLQFKKESKQFGSQRQASESLAVEIAMENLARTAGYPDPIRLTWAMETEEAKAIMNRAEILTYDDYTIELKVDGLGKSKLIAKRKGKALKSIPAKLRKEKEVEELKDFHKRLKNQYSRSRKSLEEAMVRGDAFETEEINTLSTHPVIAPMLSALALISDGHIGLYKNGELVDENGEMHAFGKEVRIAHCTDFYKKGNWADWQRFCFDEKMVQPFKQIFRELYVPTADELQEKSVSRRYAGHQVQPKKTVALLKSRGWTVDYEEGLQKVFHKKGFIAKMYAMADWFSPADVESPTLETVEFLDRKTYKKISFEDLSPLIFSEIMRDVDLVVSVAHVGGVDPEASQSTVEMRAAILRETTRLFKLDNVEVKGHHAHIKGQYGEYSVHLGSAVTHMKPGKYLSILPVHSQHRGRLFLPFVDDDPRSAELMSKVLLLAKDKEIKDPTVLEQLGV